MIILVLINIAIIICIYFRYYRLQDLISNSEEKIEDEDSIVLGYINSNGLDNNFDYILAEIINLNIKGHLKIEYDKEDKSKYNYTIKQNFDMQKDNIKKHELVVLDYLFSGKMEIKRIELEEKLINTFSSYNVQYNQLNNIIQEELIKRYIIDKQKLNELKRFPKIYKRISIIVIIMVLIMKTFAHIEISSIYFQIYILEVMFSIILFMFANSYTDRGKRLKDNIVKYKDEIQKQEFSGNSSKIEEVVHSKKFADSIALHVNSEAKEKILDNQMLKNATNSTKKALIIAFTILIVLIFIGLILVKITQSATKEGIFWIYAIFALLIACSADITKAISTSKSKKF